MDVNDFLAQGDAGASDNQHLAQPAAKPTVKPASTNSAAKNPLQFFGNAARDLGGLVTGIPKVAAKLGGDLLPQKGQPIFGKFVNPLTSDDPLMQDLKGIGKGVVQQYSDIIHHPVSSLLTHPLNTALAFLPAAEGAKAALAGEAGTAAEAGTAVNAAEATKAATGAETADEAASAAKGARDVVQKPGFFTRLRNNVANTAPEDVGNPATSAGKSEALQTTRGAQGFAGTASEQGYQAHQMWVKAANTLDNTLPLVSKTVDPQELLNNISDKLYSSDNPTGMAYKFSPIEDQRNMAKVVTSVNQMIKDAAKNNDNGELSAVDLNNIRKQISSGIKTWGMGASPSDAMAMGLYHEVSSALAELSPQAQDLLQQQSQAISYGQQLEGAGAGGRTPVRLRGASGSPLGSIPIPSDALFPALKDFIGRTGEALTGGTPGAGTAGAIPGAEAGAEAGAASATPGGLVSKLVRGTASTLANHPIAATLPVIGSETNQNQQAQQQGLQAANAQGADFTQPGEDVSKILQQSQKDPRDNPTGYSVADLQGMIAKDIATTGGKNYTSLNRLLSLAKEATPQLTGGAVTKITAYNGALTALDQVDKAFKSGDSAKVGNTISEETPAIAKAFGLSAVNKADVAQLNAMLPAPGDDAYTAQQKLLAIKQALDARAGSDVQSEQSKDNAVNALLSGVGAGGTQ